MHLCCHLLQGFIFLEFYLFELDLFEVLDTTDFEEVTDLIDFALNTDLALKDDTSDSIDSLPSSYSSESSSLEPSVYSSSSTISFTTSN